MQEKIASELKANLAKYRDLSPEDREETTKTAIVVIANSSAPQQKKIFSIYQIIVLFVQVEGQSASAVERISDIVVESIDDPELMRAIADDLLVNRDCGKILH